MARVGYGALEPTGPVSRTGLPIGSLPRRISHRGAAFGKCANSIASGYQPLNAGLAVDQGDCSATSRRGAHVRLRAGNRLRREAMGG
jgi:hypothetical protein